MKNKYRRWLSLIALAMFVLVVAYGVIGSTKNGSTQAPDGLDEHKQHFINALDENFKRADAQILFYGKVVDQDGNPVSGAEINATVTYYAGLSTAKMFVVEGNDGERQLTINTDSEGRFLISGGKGRSLVITVAKEGYVSPEYDSRYIYDPEERNRHQPDPQKPVAFTLWKKTAGESLIESSASIRIEADDVNRVYTLNLISNESFPSVSDQGDMVVEAYNEGRGLDKETGRYVRQKYDWSVKLTLPGGGLIETNDPYLYRAPLDGYEDTIAFYFDKKDPSWTIWVQDLNCYFRDKNGRFGSMRLSIRANANGNVTLRFKEIRVNPTGSRNLQPRNVKGGGLSPEVKEWLRTHKEND